MKTRNLLIAVIFLLVLVNIGTLTFIWVNRPGKEPVPPDTREFLVRELSLDRKQQIIQNALMLNHRKKMKELQFRDQALHNRFFNLLTTYPSDSLLLKKMTDSIAWVRVKMEESTFRYFDQLRRILTPEQQERFDTVFRDLLRVIIPVPPPPPPAPPPPPPALDMPPPPPPPKHK